MKKLTLNPKDMTHEQIAAMVNTLDLKTWDWILVNTSAGKDSLYMMGLIVARAKAQGVLDRVIAVHADLGRMEWKGTGELAKAQADHFGIPLTVVTRAKGDILDQVRERRASLDAKGKTSAPAWPSSAARYCTSDHKRDQIAKVIRKLDGKILNCMGLRAEESSARAKRPEWELNKRISTKTRLVVNYHPILEVLETEVWDTINKTPELVHGAYALGMPRLSCVFCIFAPKAALKIAGKANPELLDTLVDLEVEVRSTFKADLSLAEVKKEIEDGIEDGCDVEGWTM